MVKCNVLVCVNCLFIERKEDMHAVSNGGLLPASPASYLVSTPPSSNLSIWRPPRSTVSSPEFSDSKDEEDMDIDQDQNSLQTDSQNHRTLSLFSLSDLRISDQKRPAPSYAKTASEKHHSLTVMSTLETSKLSSHSARHSLCALTSESDMLCISEQERRTSPHKKAVLSKRAHSFSTTSAREMYRLSSRSARHSLCASVSESDDSDCPFDITQVSTLGISRTEQSSLASLNEENNASLARDTSRSTSLLQEQYKLSCSTKSFLFSVAFLLIAVAVFVSFVQQSPSSQCVDYIDVDSLRHELQNRVHGQHIAVNVVVERLEEFTSALDRRQLVMSFHGWTGIGKNFMSSIIAQYLPPANVHKLIIPLHFAQGTENEAVLLLEWILSNISSPSCGLHLFIVDEIDKAASSLVRSLRDTLSELSLQSDTSSRAVFLLLTNDGASEINTAVTEVLMNGGSREDLGYVDLVPHLHSEWYTELASAKLIDQMVPFLPLERQHVVQCVESELKQRQVYTTQRLIDNIVNSLSYFPKSLSLFSSSGCRRISQLVDLFL